jgi:hypothetical protein
VYRNRIKKRAWNAAALGKTYKAIPIPKGSLNEFLRFDPILKQSKRRERFEYLRKRVSNVSNYFIRSYQTIGVISEFEITIRFQYIAIWLITFL